MSKESFPIAEEPKDVESESVEQEQVEQEVGQEKERGFDLDFYITDHSADKRFNKTPDELRELYVDIAKDGVGSIRYDWDWRWVEPKTGEYDRSQIEQYAEAKKMMHEAGLKEPTIILSNPPEWAKELYKQDPEKFFEEYAKYVAEVKNGLELAGGEPVTTIQVLNELNNSVYNPIKIEDLPRLCQITRDAFKGYNPNIKLTASLLAANLPEKVRVATEGKYSFGTRIEEYLPKLKKIKDSFDVIAVDYYPGMWHVAPGNFDDFKARDLFRLMSRHPSAEFQKGDRYKMMIDNMDLLKSVFKEIATWGMEYELGEVGMRTNESLILPVDEKAQRYFYDVFSRAFKKMLLELQDEGLELPTRFGLYSAADEPPPKTIKSIPTRIASKLGPFPEYHMGMRDKKKKRKMILQGSPHSSEEQRAQQPSQLKNIISYLRAPVEK